MTLAPPNPTSRGLQIIKVILYILAGLVLLVGMIIGISLMSSADRLVANVLLPIQLLGIEAISNSLAPLLNAFLFNLGVAILIFTLIISALLYGLGHLINHIVRLEMRLACLEAGA
jgi:hypothetical protein